MEQFLRIRRNCSNHHDFSVEVGDMYQHFRERGYSHKAVGKARKRAGESKRETLIVSKPKETDSNKKGIPKDYH